MPSIVVQTDDTDFINLCRASDEQIHFVPLTQSEARKLCGDHVLTVDDESGNGETLDNALDEAQGDILSKKHSRVYIVLVIE